MRSIAVALCAVAIGGAPLVAAAQSAPDSSSTTDDSTQAGSTPPASPFTFSGYLAGSYDDFDTTPALRAFDTRKRGLVFNQAAATFAFLPTSGFGGQVTMIGGEDAKILRMSEKWPPPSHGSPYDLFNAWVQYAAGPLTLMAGKFATLAGAEYTNPTLDALVSRSLLFQTLEPLTHTGVRAVYTVSPALSITGGINNGWNFVSKPSGEGQTAELGASGTVGSFTYAATMYRGDSPLFGGNPVGVLQLVDLVGTWNASSTWSFSSNVDLLSKAGAASGGGTGHAKGLALYATWMPSAHWQAALRGETVDDSDGLVTGIPGNTVNEASIAGSYLPSKSWRLSVELRRDHSDQPYLMKSGQPVRDQTSLELQAIWMF